MIVLRVSAMFGSGSAGERLALMLLFFGRKRCNLVSSGPSTRPFDSITIDVAIDAIRRSIASDMDFVLRL